MRALPEHVCLTLFHLMDGADTLRFLSWIYRFHLAWGKIKLHSVQQSTLHTTLHNTDSRACLFLTFHPQNARFLNVNSDKSDILISKVIKGKGTTQEPSWLQINFVVWTAGSAYQICPALNNCNGATAKQIRQFTMFIPRAAGHWWEFYSNSRLKLNLLKMNI